jgi:hypothetical protein
MKKIIYVLLFLLITVSSCGQRRDQRVRGSLYVAESLFVNDSVSMEDIAHVLADTFGMPFGYMTNAHVADGLLLGYKLVIQDTMLTRWVFTDWTGTGNGDGFVYDILADTNFMDATPLITVANDFDLSNAGGRGSDSVGRKIPPGYWVWAVIDGTPTTTPTRLAGELLYTEARGQTPSSFFIGGSGGGTPPAGDSTNLSFAQWLFENNTADSSGAGNNLTGAPDSYDSSNPYQGTYSGEYETSVTSTFNGALFDNDTIYYALAMYNESSESDRTRQYFLSLGNTTDGITMELDGINGDLEVHRYVSGSDSEVRTGNGDFTEDAWHTVIIQIFGTTCNIYIDGTLSNSGGSTLTGGMYNTGTATLGTNLESWVDNIQPGNAILTADERNAFDTRPAWVRKREN